ncbi:MAG: periplasmic heavy metal sensor [Victivallales bacterium]|jgi:Spy/CpxP family protein refolding chaperone|nr:periplasmic heavy metal sensor [Victivallales bacterium]
MWKKIRPLLILLSVTLNIAFVVFSAAYALPGRPCGRDRTEREEGGGCALRRQLGATDAQWREIEPRLVEFQKSARAVCKEVNRARGEMIGLIAAPEPDREAIRAKQEEILAGQRRMQELVIDHLLSQKKALTQDQQRELFDMLRQRAGCAGHGPIAGPMRGSPSCRSPEPEKHGRMAENE